MPRPLPLPRPRSARRAGGCGVERQALRQPLLDGLALGVDACGSDEDGWDNRDAARW